MGFDGYLASHEPYFYILEAIPMMPPFILFNIWHPGRIAKGGFGIITIDATHAGVILEEGPKNSDGEDDSSNERL